MHTRRLLEDDLALFYSHALKENWDIEDTHIRTLLKTNPDDFFIFYEEHKLVGFVVALKENEQLGFISSLLVVPTFRSLGYGKKILSFAMEYLGERQIALDSVLGQESFYTKFGFSAYFDVIDYKFLAGSVLVPQHSFKVIDLNQKQSLHKPSEYIIKMLIADDVSFKAILKEPNISAYAFSFAYKEGYKITLNTDDINEAVTLFLSLAETYKKGTPLYIKVSKLSALLEAIAQALHMQEGTKFTRMYNKVLST